MGELQIELLNFFPPSEGILIEELTWDISSEADISDAGVERLTIWYVYPPKDKINIRKDAIHLLPDIWEAPLKDNARQLPIAFKKWDIHTQF